MGPDPNPGTDDNSSPKKDDETEGSRPSPSDREQDKLREKLEKLKKQDPNVYPLF